MEIHNVMKLEALNNFFSTVDPITDNYTQFTIDFLAEWCGRCGGEHEDLKVVLPVLEYEVENILEIINSSINDYKFFIELKQILQLGNQNGHV